MHLDLVVVRKGEKVEVNDEKSYNNGVKVVPSFLLEPEVVGGAGQRFTVPRS